MAIKSRLLVVAESLGIGGTESHLIRVLPRLKHSGLDVAVFCVSGRGERAAQLEDCNIEVRAPRHLSFEAGQRRHPKQVARAAFSLFNFMKSWQPEIVHFYLPGPYVVGAPLALAQRVPVKLMSRRSLSLYQRSWPLVARIERNLHTRMDGLIGNSQAVVEQLIGEGGPKNRVRLIYNGVEALEPALSTRDAKRELGIEEDVLVASVIGALIHYKGHEDLIRGFGSVASRLPPKWVLLVAGRDEGQGKKLRELADCCGIGPNIQFLGQRSDIPRLLAASDFGVLTSHEEGFSNAILENMSAGLPMVVTDVGGNPEAVLHGQTGFVVPPRDSAAIGEAVLQLASDASLRARFGKLARERVKHEFSLERCVAAHAELYEELRARARAVPANGAQLSPQAAPVVIPSRRPLMLAYWGRFGALPQLTFELAEASQRAGRLDQTTISISTSNELFDKYLDLGESLFPVITYPSAFAAANYRAAGRVVTALGQRLRQDGTRAFVTLMPHVWSPLAVPMLRKAGVRHTVIVHDADPHRGDNTALINKWLLREAKQADQVVTLTSAVAERLVETGALARDKLFVLFHPDLHYAGTKKRARGALRILFFGRILPYKGLSLFVDAMEILKQNGTPIEIGVFGAGSLGSDAPKLERLGAEVVNRWIAPEQIAEILGRHDLVVVSHTEASQSGVIAAAHGAGLPVVATPVGGLSEQIIPEVTGIVAKEVTAKAIAEAIGRVVENRELLDRLQDGIAATKQGRSIDEFLYVLSDVALGGRDFARSL